MSKGTHGTCLAYAEKINKEGFTVDSNGRAGTGAYFWAYHLDKYEIFAKELASAWWHFQHNKGRYDNEAKKDCAVIFVEIDVSGALLDFEDSETREKFIMFANTVYRKLKGKSYKRDYEVYDLFVDMLEKELKLKFDVLFVRLAPPDKSFYKPSLPMAITGAPMCYVVKNSDRIQIARIDKC